MTNDRKERTCFKNTEEQSLPTVNGYTNLAPTSSLCEARDGSRYRGGRWGDLSVQVRVGTVDRLTKAREKR